MPAPALWPLPASPADFHLLHWGLVAGVATFAVTVGAVLVMASYSSRVAAAHIKAKGGGAGVASPAPDEQEERPPLYDCILEAAAALPVKPEAAVLEGRRVALRPAVAADHAAYLFEASSGEPFRGHGGYDAEQAIWRYMYTGPYESQAEFERCRFSPAADARAFVVVDSASQELVGMLNIMRNTPRWLTAELGAIWYLPWAQRRGFNTEATYLALRHLFELGYRRVEWKCDSGNRRSRAAAERMGFQFEGVFRKHMIVRNRNRDTAWFAITNTDWSSGVKEALERRLGY